MSFSVPTRRPPAAPCIYTAQEAKVWQWGWIAGWQTSVPAYLPEPGVFYTEQEGKVWLAGRDAGFLDRMNHVYFNSMH